MVYCPTYCLTYNSKKSLIFICKQKTNFILSIFLEISQIHYNFVILATLGKPAYTHPKCYYHLAEHFHIFLLLQAKEQLHPSCFSRDIAKICKLLCLVLWAYPTAHTQNFKMNLLKILLFLCMPKINFIIHFLEILNFKESCGFASWQHFSS